MFQLHLNSGTVREGGSEAPASDCIPNTPDSFLCLIKLHILIFCAKTSFSNESICLYGMLSGNPGVQKVAGWGAEKKKQSTQKLWVPHTWTQAGVLPVQGGNQFSDRMIATTDLDTVIV